jgi:hypothetical protein
MFVNAIETLPALALSEVVSNFSWPSGLAVRLSAPAALVSPLAGAGVAALDVVGVAALLGVEAEELVLLEELPQPASAITPNARTGIEDLARNRAFA